ncbi:MAG: DNA cytosine methyltransferase [Bacteroidales bacterium]|nr:DNA cytosine methyltransferase [Bacteroidales bacterium]
MEKNKLKYIDLFAGCGGLSLGLYNTGIWEGIFAIEKSPDAFLSLKHNLIEKKKHFDWPEWLPQKEHDINEILKNHHKELHTYRGIVDLVVGGPPCQGFSTAGRRNENDDRNSLLNKYIQFIRLVQPKIIFFENVKGFTLQFGENKTKGKIYSDYVTSALQQNGKDYTGYDVFAQLIDFSEYGVPQKRTRFILIGIRKDYRNDIEAQIFFELIKKNKTKFIINKGIEINPSLQDAISDLLSNKDNIADSLDSKGYKTSKYLEHQSNYQKIMRQGIKANIPDSHRLTRHSDNTVNLFLTLINNTTKGKRLTDAERKKFNVKKRSIVVLNPNSPTPTTTTHPDDYVHYCEPRILTVREYARVQSFPDDFEFKGKYTTGGKLRVKEVPRYSQIGNAIPPLFGELAGLTLKELLNE